MYENSPSKLRSEYFEKLCERLVLEEAFVVVKRNKGAPGIDGVTIEQFESQLAKELDQLQKELQEWTYTPRPVRRVEIP